MSQNILSYTSRDYDSIKQDLIDAIPNLTSIWTNREEADPGMVLLTLMSALGDNLSFNMDKQSLEFYGKTVTQRKNAVKIFDLIGYKLHWYKSAKLNVSIYNQTDNDITLHCNIMSPDKTQILSSSSVNNAPQYILLPDLTNKDWRQDIPLTINAKSYLENLTAIQGTISSLSFNSSSIDENNRYYLSATRIDQDHMWLHDNTTPYKWERTDSISELTDALPRFEFGVDEYNLPYLEFVPYWKSKFGENHVFTLYFVVTRGATGGVTSNVLDTVLGINRKDLIISHGSNTVASPDLRNVPGADPQTARDAYFDSRNYIGTYNTLVTIPDFEKFFRRFDIVSNVIAIDKQRAIEYNETVDIPENKIAPTTHTQYVVTDGYSMYDVIENSFTAHDITYNLMIDSDGNLTKVTYNGITVDTHLNAFVANNCVFLFKEFEGEFKPYQLEVNMVLNDFEVYDSSIPKTIAVETNKVVRSDSGEDYGYISYTPSDYIIGDSDDSMINQSNLNDYKLRTVDLTYGAVRKFPFYVDGKIYLKEPKKPRDANVILSNVHSALKRYFSAFNLTMGQKIKFSDIIAVIMSADENIDYFDAGANNINGSMIVYPNRFDANPNKYDAETQSYDTYGINIDPQYFNLTSLQHYEDILYPNASMIYWGDTVSKHLSIAETSIYDKNKPNLANVTIEAHYEFDTGVTQQPLVKIDSITPDVKNLYEFALANMCILSSASTSEKTYLATSVPNTLGITYSIDKATLTKPSTASSYTGTISYDTENSYDRADTQAITLFKNSIAFFYYKKNEDPSLNLYDRYFYIQSRADSIAGINVTFNNDNTTFTINITDPDIALNISDFEKNGYRLNDVAPGEGYISTLDSLICYIKLKQADAVVSVTENDINSWSSNRVFYYHNLQHRVYTEMTYATNNKPTNYIYHMAINKTIGAPDIPNDDFSANVSSLRYGAPYFYDDTHVDHGIIAIRTKETSTSVQSDPIVKLI